jgi:hypothetical protein
MEKKGKRVVQLLAESSYSECAVCGITKNQAIYRYKAQQYIEDYIPPILEPVCRKCIYREIYGTKGYRKKMKERSLDG